MNAEQITRVVKMTIEAAAELLAERAKFAQFIDAFGLKQGVRLAVSGLSFAEAQFEFERRQQLDAAFADKPGIVNFAASIKLPK